MKNSRQGNVSEDGLTNGHPVASTIEMRNKSGRKTFINVTAQLDGTVDLVFSRSSEGEILIMLPKYAAAQLADLLHRATSSAPSDDRQDLADSADGSVTP